MFQDRCIYMLWKMTKQWVNQRLLLMPKHPNPLVPKNQAIYPNSQRNDKKS